MAKKRKKQSSPSFQKMVQSPILKMLEKQIMASPPLPANDVMAFIEDQAAARIKCLERDFGKKTAEINRCALRGEFDKVSQCLDRGEAVDVTAQGKNGLLHCLMLHLGSDVEELGPNYLTDFILVEEEQGPEALAALIAKRCGKEHAALDPISRSIEAGAAVNAQNAEGETPLFLSMNLVGAEVAGLLLDKGADVSLANAKGETPLMRLASWPCHVDARLDLAKRMLALGADVNAATAEGMTALHLAVRYSGSPKLISLLLEAGANVNACNAKGETPLHTACAYSREDVVPLFLQAGASPNAADKTGRTPLFACACGLTSNPGYAPDCAKFLLKAGADVRVKDAKGKTALEAGEVRWANLRDVENVDDATVAELRELLSPKA